MRTLVRAAITGLCVLSIVFLAHAQSIAITGTVRDQNRQPLSGVTVSLAVSGTSATTGSDGSYSLGDAGSIRNLAGKGLQGAVPVIDRGLLRFSIGNAAARVRVRLFDLKGTSVVTVVDADMVPGDYRIDPYIRGLAARVYLLKIGIGSRSHMLKMPATGSWSSTTGSRAESAGDGNRGLSEIAVVNDTLRLVKNGYSYETKVVDSYSGVHDIIMTDTAWFWGDRSKIPAAKNVMTYVFLNRTYGKFTDEQMFWKFGDRPIHSFAEAPYYDMEANSSGRVYCYAGASDSKYNDFMEHTISSTTWNGNTTRVDGFVLPCAIRLHCKDGYDVMLGEEYHMFAMSRDSLWKAYLDAVPVEFDSCARWNTDGTPYRIVAPGKGEGVFNTGQKYADYFSAYLQQIGQGSSTTNQVFSCTGTPYGNNAALAGATNRHVAHLPKEQWKDKSLYYKEAPANFYAKFWHDHSFDGKAYGFAYDDAEGQAAYASHGGPEYLIVAVGW